MQGLLDGSGPDATSERVGEAGRLCRAAGKAGKPVRRIPEVRIAPRCRLRASVRPQVARRPAVAASDRVSGLPRGALRKSITRQLSTERSTDAAAAATGLWWPCESATARTVNGPSIPFHTPVQR